jgi:hypothetical protein
VQGIRINDDRRRMTVFHDKIDKLYMVTYQFMLTPAYRVYQSKVKDNLWMISHDIYTDPRYGEDDAERWGLYFGRMRADGSVSLGHGKGSKARYFATPEAAQVYLNGVAEKNGWKLHKRRKRDSNGRDKNGGVDPDRGKAIAGTGKRTDCTKQEGRQRVWRCLTEGDG